MTTAESGYTWCGCRDCFEIVIGPMDRPELCSDCQEAGCEIDSGECQRFDAYTKECEHERWRVVDELISECIDCGIESFDGDIPGVHNASRGASHDPQ